jgi:hypothetical protein
VDQDVVLVEKPLPGHHFQLLLLEMPHEGAQGPLMMYSGLILVPLGTMWV